MDKKLLIWCLLTISAMVTLSLFFTGPMDMARNIDGPGQSVSLDTTMLPEWWTRFDLILRYKSGQNCRNLRAIITPETTGEKPIQYNQKNALFRIQSNTAPPPVITLFNPTNQELGAS